MAGHKACGKTFFWLRSLVLTMVVLTPTLANQPFMNAVGFVIAAGIAIIMLPVLPFVLVAVLIIKLMKAMRGQPSGDVQQPARRQ